MDRETQSEIWALLRLIEDLEARVRHLENITQQLNPS